jgi:DNA modification methylase
MKMSIKILQGNCLKTLSSLEEKSVNTCVTSPPYWGLRDYGNGDQLGQEETPEKFVDNLVNVFREVRRVLRDDGTVWLNLGDSYCGTGHKGDTIDSRYEGCNGQKVALNNKIQGLKSKDLVGIPWRVAFALQADGWYLRQDIIWHKPNPMPESVTDRCTKAHEYIFLLSKSPNIITTMKLLRKTARNLQKIV